MGPLNDLLHKEFSLLDRGLRSQGVKARIVKTALFQLHKSCTISLEFVYFLFFISIYWF